LVNTLKDRLAVKDQLYIPGIEGVVHAYPSSGNHLSYRNKRLTILSEFHEIATSSGLISSHSLDTICYTFGPHLHTSGDKSCVDSLFSPDASRLRN